MLVVNKKHYIQQIIPTLQLSKHWQSNRILLKVIHIYKMYADLQEGLKSFTNVILQ